MDMHENVAKTRKQLKAHDKLVAALHRKMETGNSCGIAQKDGD